MLLKTIDWKYECVIILHYNVGIKPVENIDNRQTHFLYKRSLKLISSFWQTTRMWLLINLTFFPIIRRYLLR